MWHRRTLARILGILVALWPVLGNPSPTLAQRSAGELETLAAPIALYPDPLMAQMLPAATYPDEVAAAADYVRQYGPTDQNIDRQHWDSSVKAIARYPEALDKMAGDLDWTTQLGDAFLNQRSDLFDAIQTLRARAEANGALATNDKQVVVADNQNIKIVPAQDDTVYVPQYDPQVVYAHDDDDDDD